MKNTYQEVISIVPASQAQMEDLKLQKTLARLEAYARLMDDLVLVPGTNFRFGIDPLLGVVPLVGNVLGLIFALYPLFEALRWHAPVFLMLRLILNLGIDFLMGLIPWIGILSDALWKGNLKNALLLRKYLIDRSSRILK